MTRLSPHSREVEKALLGALLRGDRAGNDEAIASLSAEHFYSKANAAVFDAIATLHEAGAPHDPIAVDGELRRMGAPNVAPIEQLRTLREMATGEPVLSAQVLHDDLTRRRLIHAADEIVRIAHDATDRAPEALERAQRLIDGISGEVRDLLPPTSDRIAERLRQIETGADPMIVPTGIHRLDDMIGGGLRPGRMYVIAAESGLGKSAVALQIADNIVRTGRPVLFVSYEMLWDEVLNRRVSMATGLPTNVVENSHNMTGGAKPRIIAALQEMADDPLYVEDSFAVGLPGVKARTRRLLREKHGPPLVVIDYLQQAPTNGIRGELAQQIEMLSQEAHRIAKLRVPVIVVAQMNRTGDILGSGGIKRYADVVMELEAVRNDVTDSVLQLNLRIRKQRGGQSNQVATFEPIGADFRLHPKRDISIEPGAVAPSRYAKGRR